MTILKEINPVVSHFLPIALRPLDRLNGTYTMHCCIACISLKDLWQTPEYRHYSCSSLTTNCSDHHFSEGQRKKTVYALFYSWSSWWCLDLFSVSLEMTLSKINLISLTHHFCQFFVWSDLVWWSAELKHLKSNSQLRWIWRLVLWILVILVKVLQRNSKYNKKLVYVVMAADKF